MSQPAVAHITEVPDTAEGPLSTQQKALVRESFARIEPAIELVVQLFYRRLFDIAPEVRPLFSEDMQDQRRKLISALRLSVAAMDKLDDLVPTLKLLGAKHRSYGVHATHYGAVGEALLWTLRQSLKNHFTPEVHDAWVAVYTVMAETMHESE